MDSQVEVQEITDEQARQLTEEYNPRGVNLGGSHSATAAAVEANINDLVGRTRKSGRRFLVTWEGDKIPQGTHVLNYEIGWTQNGQVTTTSGEVIGSYDRLVEFGGASGKQQKMLIYLYRTKS